MDVLTVLLQNEDRIDIAREQMLRETGFYFLASAHTSVHSLGHAVHHLLTWCDTHPDARAGLVDNPTTVQRFVHESFRLHPSSPVAKRRALATTGFLDGQTANEDDTVVINLREANRCTDLFGADAATFNPYRKLPVGLSETGITFGIGMHACLGKNLAAGVLSRDGQVSDSHQYGTVPWISHQLLKRGIRRHPLEEAKLDQAIARETWAYYPVTFAL